MQDTPPRCDAGPFPVILGKGPWPKLEKKDPLNIDQNWEKLAT